MNYAKYIEMNINPQTGLSVLLDKGHYSISDRTRTYKKNLVQSNEIPDKYREDIMCLVAFGLKINTINNVMCKLYKELSGVNKGTFKSIISYYCIYYSYHNSMMESLKSTYKQRAKQLLDKYENNKDDKNNKNKSTNENLKSNNEIELPSYQYINELLREIIKISNTRIPDAKQKQELLIEEQNIKMDLLNCHNIEVGNKLMSKLRSVWCEMQYKKSLEGNEKIYNAIRSLNECGVITAIYRWIELNNN